MIRFFLRLVVVVGCFVPLTVGPLGAQGETWLLEWPRDREPAVTVEIFAQFHCPYCQRFSLETLRDLRAAYGDSVRFVPRPIAWDEPQRLLAVAAECAVQQGLYWNLHERLYDVREADDTTALIALADEHGLDAERFEICLAEPSMASLVDRTTRESYDREVTGVPTVFIGRIRITGAQAYSAYTSNVDGALADAASPGRSAGTRWLAREQQDVVDDFGYPDVFKLMEVDDADGRPARYEYWTYFKGGITYAFRDGTFLTATEEPYPAGGVVPTPYRPEQFVLGDSAEAVAAALDPADLGSFDVAGGLVAGGEVMAGDRLLLGFLDGRLVYVETLATAAGGG